jgi:hypothetical protein
MNELGAFSLKNLTKENEISGGKKIYFKNVFYKKNPQTLSNNFYRKITRSDSFFEFQSII